MPGVRCGDRACGRLPAQARTLISFNDSHLPRDATVVSVFFRGRLTMPHSNPEVTVVQHPMIADHAATGVLIVNRLMHLAGAEMRRFDGLPIDVDESADAGAGHTAGNPGPNSISGDLAWSGCRELINATAANNWPTLPGILPILSDGALPHANARNPAQISRRILEEPCDEHDPQNTSFDRSRSASSDPRILRLTGRCRSRRRIPRKLLPANPFHSIRAATRAPTIRPRT